MRMKNIYLVNSPIMPNEGYYHIIYYDTIGETFVEWKNDLKRYLERDDYELVSAIGHKSIVDLINNITGLNIKENRIAITFTSGDVAFGIKLNFRIPEGKIYSEKEIWELFREGKIIFFSVLYCEYDDFSECF